MSLIQGGVSQIAHRTRLVSMALAVSILSFDLTPAAAEPQSFVDVPVSHQFAVPIAWMSNEGITNGYELPTGKREFRPGGSVTRDAMAAFLYRYAGEPAYTPPVISPFVDVATSNQFYREIAWLAEEGISRGWEVGSGRYEFRPLLPIARDAMAVFLYRFSESPAVVLPEVSPFVDVSLANPFADAIAWLAENGISTGWPLGGGQSAFLPLNPISREAMAAFLYRHDSLGNDEISDPISSTAPTIVGVPSAGEMLEATVTDWGPLPLTFTYQWNRDGAPIGGATESTYRATVGDVGTQISVSVTASKPGTSSVTRHSAGVAISAASRILLVTSRITTDTVWSSQHHDVIVIRGSIFVDPGIELRVEPGVIIKVEPGSGLYSWGDLVLGGTEQNPIILTSGADDTVGGDTNGDGGQSLPTHGDWPGLTIWGETGSLEADHVVVRYASQGVYSSGTAGQIILRNSEISETNTAVDISRHFGTAEVRFESNSLSGTVEIVVTASTSASLTFRDNHVVAPTHMDETTVYWGAVHLGDARLRPSQISGNTIVSANPLVRQIAYSGLLVEDWTIDEGQTLVVSSSQYQRYGLQVDADVTLTLSPGATVKVRRGTLSYTWMGVTVVGSLVVNGTPERPVAITSITDHDRGVSPSVAPEVPMYHWGTLRVLGEGALLGSHLNVLYGRDGIHGGYGTTIDLRSSSVTDMSGYCLQAYSAAFTDGTLLSCPSGVSSGTGGIDARGTYWGDEGPQPFGDGVPLRGEVLVVPWDGFVAPEPPPVVTSTSPLLPCVETLIVGVRGSGEAPGGPVDVAVDPDLYDAFSYDSGSGGFGLDFRGLGMRLQELLTGETLTTDPWGVIDGSNPALLDTLTAEDVSATRVQALRYPAASTELLLTTFEFDASTLYLRANPERLAHYLSSILWGVDRLDALIRDESSRCPDQNLVLMGYSQGAMVIHMTLASMAQESDLLSQVRGVVLLADPLRNPWDRLVHTGSASENTQALIDIAFEYPAVVGLLDHLLQDVGGADVFTAAYPSALSGRTVSICNLGDALCDPVSGDLTTEERNGIHGYSTGELAGWGGDIASRFW